MNNQRNISRGIGLAEVVVAVSITTLILIGIATTFQLYIRIGLGNTTNLQAIHLAEEGIEAVRFIRDEGWAANISTLSQGTTYYLEFASNDWTLSTTPSTILGFVRAVSFDDVYRRNSDSDIIASTSLDANTLDPNAKQVTVLVSWNDGNDSAHIITILTDLFGN